MYFIFVLYIIFGGEYCTFWRVWSRCGELE